MSQWDFPEPPYSCRSQKHRRFGKCGWKVFGILNDAHVKTPLECDQPVKGIESLVSESLDELGKKNLTFEQITSYIKESFIVEVKESVKS